MKKRIMAILLSVCLLVSLAACGGNTATTPDASGTETATATGGEDLEVVTLKISHNMDFVSIPNSIIEAGNRLNEKYAAEGRNLKIEFDADYQTIDWTEYHNNTIFAHKSGDAPDIFSIDDNITGYVDAGVVLDVSDIITDSFVTDIFTSATVDGKAYAVPFDLPVRVLYYNKEVLTKLGWTPEEIAQLPENIKAGTFTLEDFTALCEEVVTNGAAEYGLMHRPGQGQDFLDVLMALGGEYYDENGTLVFDEQGIKRFFEFTYDNANTKKITPANLNQLGWETINKNVGSGNTFAYYGPMYSATYAAAAVDKTPAEIADQMEFVLFPKSEYTDGAFVATAPQNVAISADTKYPEICKELFVELRDNSTDLLADHASTIYTLSSVKKANESEVLAENPIVKNVTYMTDYAVSIPAIGGINTYLAEMFKQIVSLELGQVTPEEALAEFKTQVELNVEGCIFK